MRQVLSMAKPAVLAVAVLAISLVATNAGQAQAVPQEQPSLEGIWMATEQGSDGTVTLGLAFRSDGAFTAVRVKNNRLTSTVIGKYVYVNGRLTLIDLVKYDPDGVPSEIGTHVISVKWIDTDHWTDGKDTYQRY